MHGRRIKGVQNALRVQSQIRSAATATALKPQPRAAGKWAPVEQQKEEPSTSRLPLGKWAPPVTLKPRNPNDGARRGGLGESSRAARPVIRWNKDKGKVTSTSSAPAFPVIQKPAKSSVKSETQRREREAAPHLLVASGSGIAKEARLTLPQNVKTPATTNDVQRADAIVEDIETVVEEKEIPYSPDFPSKHEANRRTARHRDQFKERGSLVERLQLDVGKGLEIPKHQRFTASQTAEKRRKASKKVLKPMSLDVFIPSVVSVQNLARLLDVRLEKLQACMRAAGMAEESSHDHILNADTACLFALEFNKNPIVDDEAAFDLYAAPVATNSSSLPRRPPVVTIMGHVDHGKTTLLDSLRSSSVAKGEAGGITQHIGAFSVSVPKSSSASSTSPSSEEGSRSITFLDTPGHAAFSAMRARGARVTDIIVLVVAADDGVMPQTREVIQLIKRESDKIGLVVAINKVDKPGADVESVQSALWAEGIHLESMGGDIPSVEVSGLTGQGLDQLVEIISVLAEIRDVRAEENGPAQGYILESKVLRGFGNTATVLLLRGSLTAASHLICGTTHAKVRHLTDSSGNPIKRAAPGSAVIVSGWKELPQVGDEVLQGKEDEVKKALANRLRKMKIASTLNDAEVINATRRAERERKAEDGVVEEESNVMPPTGPKALRLVVKGDVSGSVEALVSAVEVIGNKDATVNVVSSGVGEVTESDVMMAKAAGGMIVAFAVPVSRLADQAAAQNGVNIYSEKIIYRVLDEVKERVIDLLPKITETRVTGEATVQQMFDIHGKGRTITRVAGCRVGNGTIHKEHRAKVFRSGVLLHDGLLDTLRILKRDVTEVKKGLECGLSFVKFDDLRERDFVQMYEVIEKPGQL